MNEFVKSHALGNSFIVLDSKKIKYKLTPDNVRLLCNHDQGIGSDGILELIPTDKANFGMRVFNPDGSQPEMSGNGCRIFAKYLFDYGYTTKKSLTLDVRGRIVRCDLNLEGGRVKTILSHMGRAQFKASAIPVKARSKEVVGQTLRVAGREFNFTAVSTGNPHCVIFVDELDTVDLVMVGPKIERHEIFPNHTNVEFVKVHSRDRISVRVWERGAGPTAASGTGALAASAACVKNNYTDKTLSVEMAGGVLKTTVEENFELVLEGPASEIMSGTLSAELLSKLLE